MDRLTPSGIRTEALYGDRLVPCHAPRPTNLDAMLRATVARHGNAPALEEGERTWSYAELDREVNRIATGLRAAGLQEGERVALFMGNRLEFTALLFGIWRAGAIAVPIGIRQSAQELEYMLGQCQASALVLDAALAERLPEPGRIPSVRTLVYCADAGEAWTGGSAALAYGELLALGSDTPLPASFSDHSPACIMYTSGTTGHPKGAVLSHLGFFHTAHNYAVRFGYRAGDRTLLVIPGSHISGLLAVVVVSMLVGACMVSLREYQTRRVLEVLATRRITAAVMVPAMYNLIVLEPGVERWDLSAWRIGHFGGAAMPEVTIQRLAALLPRLELYNGFGATETTSAVSLTERGGAALHPDSVGTVLPCVDIRVLDEHGHEVAPGEAGELWIRSPGNAIGYWGNPEATAKAFIAGYWRSGDVGSLDAQGLLRVFDRIKDMINRGGFKVYCVELENVVQRYPGVIEVAAVPSPCPVLGERVHVFLHASQPVELEPLRAFCRQYLADYKLPDYVTHSATALPRNLNGKLTKAPLREQARALAAHATTKG
ncbi:MAG TPA: O-succinylbenzoic acid--CoA ligase [Comamonadaceae bacterium]|uniref:class I adenylate-forming enzyme family protein n=1 Tax=Pulveribacter sp. TaxID=2678893 RepID=UPI000EE6751D|nr:AMP-binding protein [Pulveribacter sp.]HCL87585.1 O-succinylbenzoic acid--CoA ligase [Comamonadaceae bacterium]